MSGHVLHRPLARRRPAAVPVAGWLAWLAEAIRVNATRRRLAQMDDRMLRDIGVTRAEALAESERAPWDIAERRG